MTSTVAPDYVIPTDIAKAVALAESYRDEDGIVHPALRWLRANNPFGKAVIEGYPPFWVATRHADIMTIQRNPGLFCSGRAEPQLWDSATAAFMYASVAPKERVLDTLSTMDAPEHTAIRNVTSQWFAPGSVRSREERIRAIARETVEAFVAGGGEGDFVKDFALHYPLRVLLDLFGVPRSEEPNFLSLTQEFFGAADPEDQAALFSAGPDAVAQMLRAGLDGFFAYFNELSAERRRSPTDDLASIIANATVDGEYLSEDIVNGYYMAIATAGHDTTSSSIAGAAMGLAHRPEQLALVRQDPSLIPALIDEAVRVTCPIKHFMRTVTADSEFAGRALVEGDRIMLCYPSANRDEEVFTDPDTFDILRRPNRHLGFGHGPHLCIGMNVAKLEMRLLWEELLPRVATIEQTDPARYVAANFVGGFRSLPLRVTFA